MDELFEILLRTDQKFRQLHRDHQKCEQKLEKMNSIKKLTAGDEVERKRIQKVKLQKKDGMQRILSAALKRRKTH